MTVLAKSTPNANEITIGIRNCACTLVSVISGNKPTKVVTGVRKMGLKRSSAATSTALIAEEPFSRNLFDVIHEYQIVVDHNTCSGNNAKN